MRLENKVVMITGGGGDIGRATAIRFGKEGVKVMIADQSEEAGMETVKLMQENGGTAAFKVADMTKPNDVEHLMKSTVDRFGRIDILYNNAGVNSDEKKITDVSLVECRHVIDINHTGVFL